MQYGFFLTAGEGTQAGILHDFFMFLNPRSANFTCAKSKWIYTVQSHTDHHQVFDLKWECDTCFWTPCNSHFSLKHQHPIKRVHSTTLFSTADISKTKIEWEINGQCKRIDFPCWKSTCLCQIQVMSFSNNQRFSFRHWITYIILILDPVWL